MLAAVSKVCNASMLRSCTESTDSRELIDAVSSSTLDEINPSTAVVKSLICFTLILAMLLNCLFRPKAR